MSLLVRPVTISEKVLMAFTSPVVAEGFVTVSPLGVSFKERWEQAGQLDSTASPSFSLTNPDCRNKPATTYHRPCVKDWVMDLEG